jgi:hypothetical protein
MNAATTASQPDRWTPSSPRNPCPICGRVKDGDCRISANLVLCHRGASHQPPDNLRPGHVVGSWAYTGETEDRRAAVFTLHKPRADAPPGGQVIPLRSLRPMPVEAAAIELARLPEPGEMPPPHWPNGQRLTYSPRQWVAVSINSEGKKAYIPHHTTKQGKTIAKAGPDPWPLWCESEALNHGRGQWIASAEGEKCSDIFRAGGLVAVAQPGHAHKEDQIKPRFQRLKDSEIAGMVYLADVGRIGGVKAQQCAGAAAAVGLPLLVIHAAAVWPELTDGQSIDDAPGTATERVAKVTAAIPAAIERQQTEEAARQATREQLQTASSPGAAAAAAMATVKARLQAAIDAGMGGADLQELVGQLAAETGQHPLAVERIAQALNQDRDQAAAIQAEVLAFTGESDRQSLEATLTLEQLLPPRIAHAVAVVCRYLPHTAPAAALTLLAGVAGLAKLGTKVVGSEAAGFVVPVTLFACLLGRSGQKKSPLLKALVTAPAADLIAETARESQRQRAAWEQACRECKPADRPPEPPFIRLSASEFTAEKLAEVLAAQERQGLGFLICRDELSGLFGGLNQYRSGRGSDEQQLLELFDGGGQTSLRCSGDRHYSRSQVAIIGTTQPDVLRQLVANGDASGLWARFLWAPLPQRVVRLPAHNLAEVAEREAAETTLADLYRRVFTMPPETYRLAADAYGMFRDFEAEQQLEALRAPNGAASALHGKAAGKVLRVAGLLHILAIAMGEPPADGPIPARTLKNAIDVVRITDLWALGLHAEVAGHGVGDLARTVHRTAEVLDRPVQWRDVQNKLSRKQRQEASRSTVTAAMRALAESGFGEIEESDRGTLAYRALRPLAG